VPVYQKKNGRWRACVSVHIGSFATEAEAREASETVMQSHPHLKFRKWVRDHFHVRQHRTGWQREEMG
jgi:hypothetical protein